MREGIVNEFLGGRSLVEVFSSCSRWNALRVAELG